MNQDLELPQLHDDAGAVASASGRDLRRLSAVPVELSVEIGRARMTVGETLELREGSVIPLERMADEPVDLLVNGTPIARGEVVVIDEQFGLRLTKVLDAAAGAAGEAVEAVDGEPVAPEAVPAS